MSERRVFCEMRCGFCNLFTFAKPKADVVAGYMAALRRQSLAHRQVLGGARVTRFAVGGGTPTFLDEGQLADVLELAEGWIGGPVGSVPSSVETSPATATEGRLAVLKSHGVSRVSIGVQSFSEAEVRAVARPQPDAQTHEALRRIRAFDFPVLNIDLIYGLPGQTVVSWLASVRAALRYHPEELFLYPLYVRPLTGLGKSRRAWDDLRLDCYRAARDLLLDAGYAQASLRMFRARHASAEAGPAYCVQEDGMLGLGCGARAYTRGLHYSQGYAVAQRTVGELIEEYTRQAPEDFAVIRHGFPLSEDEQRRRHLLLGLLQSPGLDVTQYAARFCGNVGDHFPQLRELVALGFAEWAGDRLRLTPAGLERSDAIGPWLYSRAVRARMDVYEWR